MLGGHDTVLETCIGLIFKDQSLSRKIVGLIFTG